MADAKNTDPRPKIGKTGEYPLGQLDPSDEGEINVAIGADLANGIVRVDFGTPVTWLGLPPAYARDIAIKFLRHAGKIDGLITTISIQEPKG